MGNILTAAQDPIFWLHHANIDRIWAEWSGAFGAHHEDPQEASWRGQTFSFFDEQGHQVTMSCDQVLDTSVLGYEYDTQSAATPAATPKVAAVSPPARELVGATDEPVPLTGQSVTVSVPIDARAAEPFGANIRVYVNVEEIQGEANPGSSYGVYVGVGAAAPPDQQAENRVGNLSFFGIEQAQNPAGDAPAHTLQSSYEMTSIARQLEAVGKWAGHDLLVTFEPMALDATEDAAPGEVSTANHEDNPVELGRISVFYDA
jgi:tyrosinase